MIQRPSGRFLLSGAILLTLVWLSGCGPTEPPADLVLLHGKLVTLDDASPEVAALAARDGRVIAVGADAEIGSLVGPETEVIDLQGRLAVPGFIETHAHLVKIGKVRMNLDLSEAATWEETVAMVRDAARHTPRGQWIYGRGWHQDKWKNPPTPNVNGYPLHDALSRVTPDHPVLLSHASGHASIANARAMARAGITETSPAPPGGEIVRAAAGRPIGVFIETAEDPLENAYDEDLQQLPPGELEALKRRQIELAMEECLSKGITSFHDAGTDLDTIDLYRKLADEESLGVRLYVMVLEDNDTLARNLAAYRMIGHGDHHLTVRAVKKQIDGALGARGAWLLEPYADLPTTTGQNTDSLEEIEEAARLAVEHGYQMCVHAIGDRANREILDLYQRVFEGHPEMKDPRWRVEHAQHLHPDDIPRFSRLGVIAAMQGIHCTSDAPWVIPRLGEDRAREGAYAWRKLIDSGAVVTNGTDAPVEDVDPIRVFHASVTRRLADGSAFFPDQRMTREEALRSYTVNAAYAAFEEDLKGTLSPGKLADITVLSRDILTVPDDEILGSGVVYTIVGGKVMYRAAAEGE